MYPRLENYQLSSFNNNHCLKVIFLHNAAVKTENGKEILMSTIKQAYEPCFCLEFAKVFGNTAYRFSQYII